VLAAASVLDVAADVDVRRWLGSFDPDDTASITSGTNAAGLAATGGGASDVHGFATTGVPSESHVACQLVASKFGWYLQIFLGTVCFISLIGKRFTDRVRRPWKVWFFDTAKQGFGATTVHFLNILLSMALGRWLDVDADPCNWYFINLTLDSTVGVLVCFILLRTMQCIYRSKCVNRPELAMSGEYGDPPSCRMFCRQLLDWQLLVILEKSLMALVVVKATTQMTALSGFLLGWLDDYPRVKLITVMVVTPLVMNVFALWMADNFLQADPAKAEEQLAMESLVEEDGITVMGKRGRGVASAADAESDRDENPEEVLSFQEWKRRSDARNKGAHGRIPMPKALSKGAG